MGGGSDPSKWAVRPTQRKEAVAKNRAFIQQKAPRFVQRLLGAGCLEGMGGEMETCGSWNRAVWVYSPGLLTFRWEKKTLGKSYSSSSLSHRNTLRNYKLLWRSVFRWLLSSQYHYYHFMVVKATTLCLLGLYFTHEKFRGIRDFLFSLWLSRLWSVLTVVYCLNCVSLLENYFWTKDPICV